MKSIIGIGDPAFDPELLQGSAPAETVVYRLGRRFLLYLATDFLKLVAMSVGGN